MKLLHCSSTFLYLSIIVTGMCSCSDNPFEDMTDAQLQSVMEIKNGIDAADSLLRDLPIDIPHQMYYDWERDDAVRLALRDTLVQELRFRTARLNAVLPVLSNIAAHILKLNLGDLDDQTYMDFRLEQVHKARQISSLVGEIVLHRNHFIELDSIVARVYAEELDYWNWKFIESRINLVTEHRVGVRDAISKVRSVFEDARSIFDAYPIPEPAGAIRNKDS